MAVIERDFNSNDVCRLLESLHYIYILHRTEGRAAALQARMLSGCAGRPLDQGKVHSIILSYLLDLFGPPNIAAFVLQLTSRLIVHPTLSLGGLFYFFLHKSDGLEELSPT